MCLTQLIKFQSIKIKKYISLKKIRQLQCNKLKVYNID